MDVVTCSGTVTWAAPYARADVCAEKKQGGSWALRLLTLKLSWLFGSGSSALLAQSSAVVVLIQKGRSIQTMDPFVAPMVGNVLAKPSIIPK
jgi:hypothetical protein